MIVTRARFPEVPVLADFGQIYGALSDVRVCGALSVHDIAALPRDSRIAGPTSAEVTVW